MSKYIGISENKLKHSIGVARKCYQIAKNEGFDEIFCRKMFMIGWCHDVGYEFSETHSEHPDISAEMFSCMISDDTVSYVDADHKEVSDTPHKTYNAIKEHGIYTENKTDEWRILNMADMQINHKGKEVDVVTRLNGIKNRYGEHSEQYLTACDICYQIGLTETNLSINTP